jgi:hypothetical protein
VKLDTVHKAHELTEVVFENVHVCCYGLTLWGCS